MNLELTPLGWATISALLLCSVYVCAFGLERWIAVNTWGFVRSLPDLPADPVQAKNLLSDKRAQIYRILELGLEFPGTDRKALEEKLLTALDRSRIELEMGLDHVGTVAVITPFIGLFGTVIGIMHTFASLKKSGNAGLDVVSGGISEALVTTAAGLIVAILAVLVFNGLKAAIGQRTRLAEVLLSQWAQSRPDGP